MKLMKPADFSNASREVLEAQRELRMVERSKIEKEIKLLSNLLTIRKRPMTLRQIEAALGYKVTIV